jgi:hypothetical protein
LERLESEGKVMAHWHDGFWQPMDTLQGTCLREDPAHKGTALWRLK